MKSELAKARSRRYLLRRRMRVIAHYSEGTMACACCGEDEYDFLTVDHINNDGAQHRRWLKNGGSRNGGHAFYTWLVKNKFPPGFQILCANCNTSKGKTGVCAHKRPEIVDYDY